MPSSKQLKIKTEQLESVFSLCKNAIRQEEYETAIEESKNLHTLLTQYLSGADFDKELFLKTDPNSIIEQQLLLDIDQFVNKDIALLVMTADDIKQQLGQANIGNKMKKAYTG